VGSGEPAIDYRTVIPSLSIAHSAAAHLYIFIYILVRKLLVRFEDKAHKVRKGTLRLLYKELTR